MFMPRLLGSFGYDNLGVYDNMKCKYWKKCKKYQKDGATCNITGGIYYEDRYAGCYRKMEEKKNG